MATLAEIYDWFMTGKKPTQSQFWASWGSFWNKNESIPQSSISGLTSVLNAKVENDQFNAHKGANDAHAALFQAKEDKTQKGAPNGYAPLDEFTKLAAQYLNIVNDLVTGGATALLSAEQGKILQTQVNAINTLLTSDNVNLDTVQELVDAIETVQLSLSTILVNDLTTGGTTKALTAEMGKQLDLIKESTANKSTSFVVDYLSNIKFPSVKAVYDFCMSTFKKKFLSFGDVSGIAHTFGVGSENTMYKFSNNNPITAMIPTNTTTPFEIGTVFETIAIGNGALTVTGAPGVTILTNLSNTSVKNEVRRYTKIDTDTWTVEGEDSNTLKLTGNQTFSGNKSASQSSEVLTLTNTGIYNYIGIIKVIANNNGVGILFSSSNGIGARFDLSGASFGIRMYSSQTAKPIDIIHDSSADIINVQSGTSSLKFNINSAGDIKAKSYNILSLNTAPASATATGTVGEIRVTSTHIYVCIANNTWVRAALTTW